MGIATCAVVGDDDQSIYGWRGAEVTHILRFQRDWPEAKVVRLEVNYRSTRAILTWANRLIQFNNAAPRQVLRAACGGGEPPRILQFKDETRGGPDRRRGDPRTDRGRGVAAAAATSPSCAAPTSSRGRSRRSCGGPRCPTCWSAACRSSTARKSATCWPISRCWPTRPTRCRCCGSSTRRPRGIGAIDRRDAAGRGRAPRASRSGTCCPTPSRLARSAAGGDEGASSSSAA